MIQSHGYFFLKNKSHNYRYVLAIAAGEILYSLIQLPFSLYQAIKGKRLISGQFLPMFDFYEDKVNFLITTQQLTYKKKTSM